MTLHSLEEPAACIIARIVYPDMEAAGLSEVTGHKYWIAWCHITEDSTP